MYLSELNELMEVYNGKVAYGSECRAWGDFVADCHKRMGMAPWDDRAVDTEVPEDMVNYWTDVATDYNGDYDEHGDRAAA